MTEKSRQTKRSYASNPNITSFGYSVSPGSILPFHSTPKGDVVLVTASKPYFAARRKSDGKLAGGPGWSFDDALAALEYTPQRAFIAWEPE